ncbi:MAG: acyloxyacyl hydrolase [Porphyromonadaceae bacterium]|nr:MAG: acyloxyacyl hydrolase [Porphyromonadaceae bacterium]
MKIICVILILAIPQFSIAQPDSVGAKKAKVHETLALQGMYQKGYVFATNSFVKGNNAEAEKINAFQAFSLKLSTQTLGEKAWEQLYKYPNWGIGLYIGDFYNPEEIGIPMSIYGFFNAPFVRWKKLSFNYELGFGLVTNWKSYNPVTNKYNIAIGARQSFLIDAGLNLQYHLTKKIDLETGFSLTHFSNGSLKYPNKGFNSIAPKISLKYNFYNRPEFITQAIPRYSKRNELAFIAFGGAKNVIFDSVNIDIREKFEGLYFPVFGVTGIYNRQVSYKSKIGIGMSVSYNGSVNAQVAVDNNQLEIKDGPFTDKLQLSIFPSYELVANKVSLILQPAFYLYRKKLKNQTPVFHQQIGLKYQINDKLFVGITLRAYYFHISDFIEWNIGYRITGKR